MNAKNLGVVRNGFTRGWTIQRLDSVGATPNGCDQDGRAPLSFAKDSGERENVHLFPPGRSWKPAESIKNKRDQTKSDQIEMNQGNQGKSSLSKAVAIPKAVAKAVRDAKSLAGAIKEGE